MDVKRFRRAFWTHFNGSQRNEPNQELWDAEVSRSLDLCPDVEGKLSLVPQALNGMSGDSAVIEQTIDLADRLIVNRHIDGTSARSADSDSQRRFAAR